MSKQILDRKGSAHVLVVDDDPVIRSAVADYLTGYAFRVSAVADGAAMLETIRSEVVDLVLLDVRLGREDGMALARRLREQSAIPIIMLTARREEADLVMGLELGADDYVTKPFSCRELLARLRAVMRRSTSAQNSLPARDEKRRGYRFAGWELNLRIRRLISPAGDRIELSKGDFSLLQAFCAAPRRVLSRDQLLELSRLDRAEVFDRSIDVQILRLRRKIETNPMHPEYIKTERGAGYIFDVAVDVVW